MCSHSDIEDQVRRCNEECMECVESFQKEGFSFSVSMCKFCPNGAKLHSLLVKTSKGEADFGNLDWNSCKYKRYYNG